MILQYPSTGVVPRTVKIDLKGVKVLKWHADKEKDTFFINYIKTFSGAMPGGLTTADASVYIALSSLVDPDKTLEYLETNHKRQKK